MYERILTVLALFGFWGLRDRACGSTSDGDYQEDMFMEAKVRYISVALDVVK